MAKDCLQGLSRLQQPIQATGCLNNQGGCLLFAAAAPGLYGQRARSVKWLQTNSSDGGARFRKTESDEITAGKKAGW